MYFNTFKYKNQVYKTKIAKEIDGLKGCNIEFFTSVIVNNISLAFNCFNLQESKNCISKFKILNQYFDMCKKVYA